MPRILLALLTALGLAAPAAGQATLYRQMGLNFDYAATEGANVPMLAALFDFAFQNRVASFPVALMGGFSLGGGYANVNDEAIVAYTSHADIRLGVELPVPVFPVSVALGYGSHSIDGDVPTQTATGALVEGRLNTGPFRVQGRVVLSSPGYVGVTGLYNIPSSIPLIGNTYVGGKLEKVGSTNALGFTFRALL